MPLASLPTQIFGPEPGLERESIADAIRNDPDWEQR